MGITKNIINLIKITLKFSREIERIFNFLLNHIVFLKNDVKIKHLKIRPQINGRIAVQNKGGLKIGSNLLVNSGKKFNPIGAGYITRLIVKKDAVLKIGDNVGISNSTFYCTERITIGSNVLFGGNCKIWDTDFHSLDSKIRNFGNDDQIKGGPITIGDNVFIGGESIILKNVSIGDNSIIGAGSVVTKNIPENEVWAGNPAKYLRTLRIDTK